MNDFKANMYLHITLRSPPLPLLAAASPHHQNTMPGAAAASCLLPLLPSLLFLVLPLLASALVSGGSPRPPLLAPVAKDPATLLYTITVSLRTPPKPTRLLVDLGASFSWVDCQKPYNSTTYAHVPCNSTLCADLHSNACGNCYASPSPSCANDSCSLFPENAVLHRAIISNALLDALALPTLARGGRNPGAPATIPSYLLSCATSSVRKGFPKGAVGLGALGRSNFSLPAQVASVFSLPFQFALCLSGSPSAPGVAFFGTAGPYFLLPGAVDASFPLGYAPLILNPVGNTIITYYGHPSDEYFVAVAGILVNGKQVPLNATLLSIDGDGTGGTKLTTLAPYTTMETSIYRAFTAAFLREAAAMNLTPGAGVKPFDVCFRAEDLRSTRAGPAVPEVDVVFERGDGNKNNNNVWRLLGANTMVSVGGGASSVCLGFVDGGATKARAPAIVVGGHQMEDNLVQFDLVGKKVGFSNSLLLRQTTCANFNFTAAAVAAPSSVTTTAAGRRHRG